MCHEKQNFNRLKTPEKPNGNINKDGKAYIRIANARQQTKTKVAKIRDSSPISLREAMRALLTHFVRCGGQLRRGLKID